MLVSVTRVRIVVMIALTVGLRFRVCVTRKGSIRMIVGLVVGAVSLRVAVA